MDPRKYIGKTIKIEKIDNGNSQIDDNKIYKGKIGVVQSVDGMGQLWGTWGGIAIIPGQDKFKVVK